MGKNSSHHKPWQNRRYQVYDIRISCILMYGFRGPRRRCVWQCAISRSWPTSQGDLVGLFFEDSGCYIQWCPFKMWVFNDQIYSYFWWAVWPWSFFLVFCSYTGKLQGIFWCQPWNGAWIGAAAMNDPVFPTRSVATPNTFGKPPITTQVMSTETKRWSISFVGSCCAS